MINAIQFLVIYWRCVYIPTHRLLGLNLLLLLILHQKAIISYWHKYLCLNSSLVIQAPKGSCCKSIYRSLILGRQLVPTIHIDHMMSLGINNCICILFSLNSRFFSLLHLRVKECLRSNLNLSFGLTAYRANVPLLLYVVQERRRFRVLSQLLYRSCDTKAIGLRVALLLLLAGQ